jgi:Mg-chelatase subunit ChlD
MPVPDHHKIIAYSSRIMQVLTKATTRRAVPEPESMRNAHTVSKNTIGKAAMHQRFDPMLRRLFSILLIAACCSGGALQAQPNLTFKRVTVNWPTIELYFSVGCNGNPAYNMVKQDFRIYENGVEVKDFTLWCPDPTARCAVSVSLVFDASGSMAGTGNAGAKQAGHAFVDMLDGVIDEATVVFFDHNVTVYQQMTTVKPLLHTAVDALPVGGLTAVWDGGYTGLIELINNGVNQCRAVILLTDGGDGSSTRQPAELIALANRHRIRVFTVGLGSSINSVELELIAQLTGGKYYQTPNAGQLVAIYQEVSTILFQGFQECMITYTRSCADTTTRSVQLQLRDFCGGSDSKSKTYRAPRDSATFTEFRLQAGDVSGMSGTDVVLPIQLLTPLTHDILHPFSFVLKFDPACVAFKSLSTPPGSALDGLPIHVSPVSEGIFVEIASASSSKTGGRLLDITLTTNSVTDTICCPVEITALGFVGGCYMPIAENGEVCVFPKPEEPMVVCDIDVPRTLTWDRTTGGYLPQPVELKARAYNLGNSAARMAIFALTYDSTVFELLSPGAVQTGTPANIFPNLFSEAIWLLKAKPRATLDSSIVSYTISFDNHKSISCNARIIIPPTDTEISCVLDVPTIVPDTANGTYDPMPFTVTVTAVNNGPLPTDTVWATITLPPGVSFASPDGPTTATKMLNIPVLAPSQSATASWVLEHPISASSKDLAITTMLTSGSEVSICQGLLHIPKFPGAAFSFTLNAGGPLSFCEGGSVSLDAGTGYASYRWSTGGVSRRLTVTSSGEYFCTVQTSTGDVGVSDTVRVIVHANPSPGIAVSGSMPFCAGDSVLLDAGAGYLRYLWSTGSTDRSIYAKMAGAYIATVWNDEGCEASDTVQVPVYPSVQKPAVQRNGDSLRASAAGMSYAWYRDGMLIPGANTQVIYVTQTGSFVVRITDGNGCWAVSAPFPVTVLDAAPVGSPPSFALHSWPDPAEDVLNIRVDDVSGQTIRVVLTDALGRGETVFDGRVGEGSFNVRLSLTDTPRGPVFIQVWVGGQVHVKKVLRL